MTFADLWSRDDFGDFRDFGYTPIHNLGDITTNRDWRNSKTGEQYIYDLRGALVVNSLNRGTFDKVPPGTGKGLAKYASYVGHYLADVAPYLRWGNALDDSSTRAERRKAFHQTVRYGRWWNGLDDGERARRTQSWIDSVMP
ncbi:MAG: hypothetical protein GY788_18200 [bacterium]|nr:hypothetical protein [bacterium]